MILERPVDPALRNLLLSGEPFDYAHLIKFERPSRPDSASGRVSTAANRYTHITDASRDIDFDDGSTDLLGNFNGIQRYIANKVLKISNVSEATEAKASTFSISIDGNGLGASISPQTAAVGIPQSGYLNIRFLDPNVSAVDEGFREGDKVTLTGTGYSGTYNIIAFRTSGQIYLKKVDGPSVPVGGSVTVGMQLSSEEVKSILNDKNSADYASFINREVFIYRIYEQDGITIGKPVLLFKGIINNVSFDDDEKGIVVTWGLTSHWGDFSQVVGRITSDDFHRALDQNGIPQPLSSIKPLYAYDKGFAHAETSINLLSTYVVQVEKQRIKSKKGFFGIGAKVKVKTYMQPEERHTDLDFNLAAKSIPVIYGVRNAVGNPIFADTLKTDSSEVYVAYAISEGEIGGIYDVYINGKSLICNDESDHDARSTQTPDNTVEVICRGRADRGDVLGGTLSTSTNPEETINFFEEPEYKNMFSLVFNKGILSNYQPYVPPTQPATYTTSGAGVLNGESISLSEPIEMTLDFFSGTEGQKASSQLVEISQAGNFKIQNDYWNNEDSAEYWGPNHRLLDTAYIVGKYKIKEGDTTIPELEFIIRGKVLECYNYDFSYAHDEKAVGENAANFPLGSYVDLVISGTVVRSNVQIIDRWSFIRADGVQEERFRFAEEPPLGYIEGVPTITKFQMRNGGGQTWTMTTYNYELLSGTIPNDISVPVDSINNDDGDLTITYPNQNDINSGGGPHETSPHYWGVDSSTGDVVLDKAILSGKYMNGVLYTNYRYGPMEKQIP